MARGPALALAAAALLLGAALPLPSRAASAPVPPRLDVPAASAPAAFAPAAFAPAAFAPAAFAPAAFAPAASAPAASAPAAPREALPLPPPPPVAAKALPEPAGARPDSDVLEAPSLPAPRVPVVAVPVPDSGVVVVATPATAGVAKALAPRILEERRDLAAILGADLVAPVQIRFGHGRAEFAGLLPGGAAPAWASGLAYPALGLVIVDVQASARGGNPGQVLRHELAHIALARAGGDRIPRWFSEGFAILHAGEWSMSRSVVLARAAGANALLPVEDLERGWPSSPTDVDLAYAQSVSLVTFLLRVEEGAAVRRLVAGLGEGRAFPAAFYAAFGQPVAGAEIDWKRSLQTRWGWLPLLFDPNLAWGAAALLLVLGAVRVYLYRRRRHAVLSDDPADDVLAEPPDPTIGDAWREGVAELGHDPIGERRSGEAEAPPASGEHGLAAAALGEADATPDGRSEAAAAAEGEATPGDLADGPARNRGP